MEALVSQDFEFNVLSKAYAEFLIECFNGYPEGRIERVPSGFYLIKDANTINVCFEGPESIAMFLKLKFGAHLRQRPAPKSTIDEGTIRELKQLAIMKEAHKKSYYDYESYYTKKYNKNDIKDYYIDLSKNKFTDEE